ncbi:MAG: arginine--tRNA ligase [Candidatus Delongbacteria bacterium]|jgi:arginyl-tRNA synthetase|nr:arginine--tRNA ligase [Candidatus Delongbacteria bacterium]MDD4204996.1 arginine--tRNA ligase [Candidatus Delongbacteria bacterium]MDY0017031.1 arginine--tRNA ligase [Candidatus Delongbacteria bacterium]
MNSIKDSVIQKIIRSFPALKELASVSAFEVPKNPEFGDTALPCFRFSAVLKKPPVAVAEELKKIFRDDTSFESVENTGGYLNFKYSRKAFAESVLSDINDGSVFERLKEEGSGKTMVIDYSSLNIAKEPHIGHLRSTIIGNSIYRIYDFLGWKVIRINHLGDWGTQFGKLIYAFISWGDEKELGKNPVRYLQDLYVRFHKEEENDPSLSSAARDWFVKLENGDPEARKLWQRFKDYTIEGIKKTYDRIDVSFDFYRGEGYYESGAKDVIKMVEASPVSKISEGALVIDLEEYGMPPCIVRKSDGATIYSTRDLAAAIDRHNEFGFDKMIYVTELKQQLHFSQVFKSLELLGYDWIKKAEHIGFGSILGISTRKGNVIYLEDIFDEAKSRVLDIMKDRDIDETQKDIIADKIGIGAVIFQDLSRSRVKNIEFDWERVLSFDGETGPYLQYSYVRIVNIIQKSSAVINGMPDFSLLTDDVTYELIKTMSYFESKIRSAYNEHEPSVMASYLINLAKEFNRFYRVNRIIGEENDVSESRIFLLIALESLYRRCLQILNIPVIDKM